MGLTPQYPDLEVDPRQYVREWDLTLQSRGIPLDVDRLSLEVRVYNNGMQLGSPLLRVIDRYEGRVRMRLSTALRGLLSTYTTWRLYETNYVGGPILQGRFVTAPIGGDALPEPLTHAGLPGLTWQQFNESLAWATF